MGRHRRPFPPPSTGDEAGRIAGRGKVEDFGPAWEDRVAEDIFVPSEPFSPKGFPQPSHSRIRADFPLRCRIPAPFGGSGGSIPVAGREHPMKKKLILGILLSVFLVWLSVRGIRFEDVADGFRSIRYVFIAPAIAGLLIMQVLRSWRWGLILKPLEAVRPWTVFEVSNVGFLAITALPARLGELVRPFLIARHSNIRMTAALGTILVERVMDGATVLFLAMIALQWTPFPPWLVRSGILFGAAMLGLIFLMIFLSFRRENAMQAAEFIIRRFPDRIAARVRGMVLHFIDGFRIVRDVRLLAQVGALSLLIWVVDVAIIYAMFAAFSLPLSITAALILMVILLIGIAIPTAPGFIGNWHYACVLGLGLFGVPKAEALPFAVVYHFISVLFIVVMGLPFLPFMKFSLADLQRQMSGGSGS